MSRAQTPARPSGANRIDLYATITDQILADLTQGVRTWTKPWAAGHAAGTVSRPLRHSFEPYSGVNTLVLWSAAVENGYQAPIWMTFRQALELGGAMNRSGISIRRVTKPSRAGSFSAGSRAPRARRLWIVTTAFRSETAREDPHQGLPDQRHDQDPG